MTRVDVNTGWGMKILYFENEKLEKGLAVLEEKGYSYKVRGLV